MDSNWKRENMRQCDPIRDGRASKEFDSKKTYYHNMKLENKLEKQAISMILIEMELTRTHLI
jgi:hypothetical protein